MASKSRRLRGLLVLSIFGTALLIVGACTQERYMTESGIAQHRGPLSKYSRAIVSAQAGRHVH